MTTWVVHATDPLAYRDGAVYVGRGVRRAGNPIARVQSPFRNPFKVGDQHPWFDRPMTLDDVVDLHAKLVQADEIAAGLFLRSIAGFSYWKQAETVRAHTVGHVHELRGSTLVCWCARVGQPWNELSVGALCHGVTLARAAEGVS